MKNSGKHLTFPLWWCIMKMKRTHRQTVAPNWIVIRNNRHMLVAGRLFPFITKICIQKGCCSDKQNAELYQLIPCDNRFHNITPFRERGLTAYRYWYALPLLYTIP